VMAAEDLLVWVRRAAARHGTAVTDLRRTNNRKWQKP